MSTTPPAPRFRAPAGVQVLRGEVPTAEAKFYLDWRLETLKGTTPLLNDVLQKLIVLDTALLGAFAGLKEVPIPEWARGLAAVAFVGSLVAAVVGIYPRKLVGPGNVPAVIKGWEEATARRKARAMLVASVFLVSGFVAGVAGMAARAAGL